MTDANNSPLDRSIDLYIQAVIGRKALDVILLDVRELTSIADVFIICSGRSSRQVTAIANYIEEYLKERKIRALSVEGKKEGQWALIDYGHVIIHIFYEPVREFYDLEGLWVDAERVQTESLAGYEDESLE